MDLQQHNPMHPGAFIKRVYLEPFGIGNNVLAQKLNVARGTVSRLINGKTNLSPEMAIKLSKVLGRSPQSWMQMQDNYDLWQAKKRVDLDQVVAIDFDLYSMA